MTSFATKSHCRRLGIGMLYELLDRRVVANVELVTHGGTRFPIGTVLQVDSTARGKLNLFDPEHHDRRVREVPLTDIDYIVPLEEGVA